jgi:hypothetical protein
LFGYEVTPPPREAVLERTRSLINAACENVFLARDLCEASRELRYTTADFREFLRDQRLAAQTMAQSMHERWIEKQTPAKTRPLERLG